MEQESQLPQTTLHARVENASDTNLSQTRGRMGKD